MNKSKSQPVNPADVVSVPNAGARPNPGKDQTDPCDAISRKRPPATNVQDANERPVEKLHELKRQQFSNGNTN